MANKNGEWIMYGMDWDDPKQDPWVWREIIAGSGEVAYGKFFGEEVRFCQSEMVSACYKEEPQISKKKIFEHIKNLYPQATDKQLSKVLK